MKAAVLHAREDLRYEEVKTPVPRSGEVLVKVRASGICGSDIPRVNGDGAHFYPMVFGHEFSGDVVEAVDTKTIKVGDRVSGVPLLPCYTCADCQRGRYSLCKSYSFIGSRVFGSFAEYIAMPEKNAVPFDSNVSYEQGALFEPSTVALHGLGCVNYRGGHDVAVLGAGTIGLFTAQWARIMGAKQVVVFDVLDERLGLGKKLGADKVINTTKANFMEEANELTKGNGFGYVFETAGATATMKMAFELAANKAGVCFIGTPSTELTFPAALFEKMNRKEFMLTGSWMSYSAPFPGDEWSLTAHFFKTGALKYDDGLIFKRMPLAKAAQAFELFKVPGAVKGKILLVNEGNTDPRI